MLNQGWLDLHLDGDLANLVKVSYRVDITRFGFTIKSSSIKKIIFCNLR